MAMRLVNWVLDYVNFDKIGIALSTLCAIHCLVTPLAILSLPIMARYYLAHPYFHFFMAALILPVGLFAFISGFMHHHHKSVLLIGIPGLFIVSFVPMMVHVYYLPLNESVLVSTGSMMLIIAHWINRRSCSCSIHPH